MSFTFLHVEWEMKWKGKWNGILKSKHRVSVLKSFTLLLVASLLKAFWKTNICTESEKISGKKYMLKHWKELNEDGSDFKSEPHAWEIWYLIVWK